MRGKGVWRGKGKGKGKGKGFVGGRVYPPSQSEPTLLFYFYFISFDPI
jgi:hypothetical protein